jgi:hypothetical protein
MSNHNIFSSKEKCEQINHNNVRIYFTHDNGERPFIVVINNNTVKIYKNNSDINITINDEDFIGKYEPIQIFVGKSLKNEMTKFSGGYGHFFDGNSILLQMTKNKYIFIGERLFAFETLNTIIEFNSPVGNNNVPYPFAIDDKGWYYLFIENVIVKNVPNNFKNDPYYYYYDKYLITTDMGKIPHVSPIDKYFWNIDEFYIGNDKYTMRYDPFPKNEYERLLISFKEKLYVIKTDGKKYELTKEQYIQLMNEFGEHQCFIPLSTEVLKT